MDRGELLKRPLFLLLTQAVMVTLGDLKDSSSDHSSRRDSSSSSAGTAVSSSGGEGISTGRSSGSGSSSSIEDLSGATHQLLTVRKFVYGLHKSGILCAAPLQPFGGVLKELGHLFCSTLTPPGTCCRNLLCVDMGAHDAPVALEKCNQCQLASYCCVRCHKQHWKQHKPECGTQLPADRG
jgi:hypothetical protein